MDYAANSSWDISNCSRFATSPTVCVQRHEGRSLPPARRGTTTRAGHNYRDLVMRSSSVAARRRMLVTCTLLLAPGVALAQAKPPARRAAPIVARSAKAPEIDSLARVASQVLNAYWETGSQFVLSASGCVLTLASKKTVGDVVTEDVQTVDVGEIEARSEDRIDRLSGTVDARYEASSGRTFVRRRRTVTIDGVPQPARTEQAIFLSLSVGREAPPMKILDMKEALLRYSIACERR